MPEGMFATVAQQGIIAAVSASPLNRSATTMTN